MYHRYLVNKLLSFKVSVKERMLRLICCILSIPDETPPAWAKEMMASLAYIQTQLKELKTQLAAMKTQMDAITAGTTKNLPSASKDK
jgi:hypothetical protein